MPITVVHRSGVVAAVAAIAVVLPAGEVVGGEVVVGEVTDVVTGVEELGRAPEPLPRVEVDEFRWCLAGGLESARVAADVAVGGGGETAAVADCDVGIPVSAGEEVEPPRISERLLLFVVEVVGVAVGAVVSVGVVAVLEVLLLLLLEAVSAG